MNNKYDKEKLKKLYIERFQYVQVLERIRIVKKYKDCEVYKKYRGSDFDKEVAEVKERISYLEEDIKAFPKHITGSCIVFPGGDGYRTFSELEVIWID